jgi:hypothetical protein
LIALNLTSIDDILSGNASFTVDVLGFCTTDEVRRESMVVNHSTKDGPKLKDDIKGRMQLLISEKDPTMMNHVKPRELQINMWGEELCSLKINRGDIVLILGARTTDKYGTMQLNVSAENAKVLINPQGY